MIKIYGNKISGACHKVFYTAILAGVEYEVKEIDFQKDLKTEWYLKIHPAGKIPAMDDDGFILFESGAISKYICQKSGSELYPKEIKKQAIVEQWIDFSNLHVGTAMSKVAYAKIFAPMRNMPVDEASLKEGYELLKRFLPIVDNELGKNEFLGGNKLTLADLTLIAVLGYAKKAEYDLSQFKNLFAWHQRIENMDFYKKVNNT